MQRPASSPPRQPPTTVTHIGWRAPARIITGALVAVALIVIALVTAADASGTTASGTELSAVQIIQVYAEGCFWAITVIGIGVAAYIATRLRD